MRYLTLALAVVLFSSLGARDAAAGWTYAATSEANGGVTVYIDFATIRTSPENLNWRRVWVLLDYSETQTIVGDRFRSSIGLSEYDCSQMRVRNLLSSLHSGNMGIGGLVYNSGTFVGDWALIASGTYGEDLLNAVCVSR